MDRNILVFKEKKYLIETKFLKNYNLTLEILFSCLFNIVTCSKLNLLILNVSK